MADIENKHPILEVVIATYGADGIGRVAKGAHPATAGVEYTVCWQRPEGEIPEAISSRPDFRVIRSDTTGLSRNRNFGLDHSRRELILIADDDTDFSSEGLKGVIDAFRSHPECGFLSFRFDSDVNQKSYPLGEFDWSHPPKGMYICSVELGLRRDAIRGLRFDERFGVGSYFCAGEEDIFLAYMLKKGIKGSFIPLTVCFHPGPTTNGRVDETRLTEAKGATFKLIFPRTWPLRMLTHTLRAQSPVRFMKEWLRGVRRLRSLRHISTT